MAWMSGRAYTFHRDWNDIDKFEGRFNDYTYVAGETEVPYDLTHRVEWAPVVAAGANGAPLDPYQEYLALKNMGDVPVLLYHNVFANWPNPPYEIVILPGHWIEVVDLDPTTQPRIRVDSALYTTPAECEVLQVGYQYWIPQEPDEYCDMWAVGHVIQDGCGTKHYPETGLWATIANPIVDNEHWLADVAGVAINDYWAVGYERSGEPLQPSAGLFAYYNGVAWAEIVVADDPPMYGIWGFAANNYWAVGAGSQIWHYLGVAWGRDCIPDEQLERDLYCVHGNAVDNIYAAGEAGLICDYNGAVWTPHFTAPEMEPYNFYGTWTSNTPNSWVCGGDAAWWGGVGGIGCIFVETPAGSGVWQSYALIEIPTLRAMWGFGDGDIWAVGDYGTIMHFNGINWDLVPEPVGLDHQYHYRGVFGCYSFSVWAIGTDQNNNNVIIHWDGAQWNIAHGPNLNEMDLLGLKGVEVIVP